MAQEVAGDESFVCGTRSRCGSRPSALGKPVCPPNRAASRPSQFNELLAFVVELPIVQDLDVVAIFEEVEDSRLVIALGPDISTNGPSSGLSWQ